MDFKLTDDGNTNDLDTTNGKLSWVTGVDAIAQKIRIKLQCFLGESPYKRDGGTPWGVIFDPVGDPELNARQILTQTILKVEGVKAVKELYIDVDRDTRTATITGSVVVDSGENLPIEATI